MRVMPGNGAGRFRARSRGGRSRLATINDVAALAGVSIKSVSRVLNNEPHVREALRQRVLAAASTLGYRPNQAARRMAGGRSFIIAFIYASPNPPAYVAGIQSGAAEFCRERGFHLVIEPLPRDEADYAEVLQRLVKTLAPDAAFVTPPLSDNLDLLALCQQSGLPLVRVQGKRDGPGRIIEADEFAPSRDMTRHLIELGHRRIGFIKPPDAHLMARARLDGFLAAMTEAGNPADPTLLVQGNFDFECGRAAAAELLDRSDPPTAIFAANDEMALGTMASARERGILLPDELSIVGFDDIPAAVTCWPPLTTVRQPLSDYGRAAAAMAIDDAIPDELDLQSRVVIRGSTAAPASRA